VSEKVVTAAVFNDKAVSLGIIEPFDLASRHDELPCSFAVSMGETASPSIRIFG
jgi:hypothetical protein